MWHDGADAAVLEHTTHSTRVFKKSQVFSRSCSGAIAQVICDLLSAQGKSLVAPAWSLAETELADVNILVLA